MIYSLSMFEKFFGKPKTIEVPNPEQLEELIKESEEELLKNLEKFGVKPREEIITIVETGVDFEPKLQEFLKKVPDTLREIVERFIREIRERRRLKNTEEIVPPHE